MTNRAFSFAMLTAGLLLASASVAQAVLVQPYESTTQLYTLDNGSRGSGTSALSETGMQLHGAFGSPPVAVGPIRYFHGEAAESQAAGAFSIAYKNNAGMGVEYISSHVTSAGPTISTTYFGGGNFDGTAIYCIAALISAGAPAIGTLSGPAVGSSPAVVAGGGVDIRRPNSDLTLLNVIDGRAKTYSFLIEADVFIPSHGGVSNNLFAGGYLDREGFGLVSPGGQNMLNINFTAGQWNALQIRYDVTLDGTGVNDTGTATRTVMRNGVAVGAPSIVNLDATQMTLRTGPIRFSPSFGLQRGWQGSAAEVFLDNITMFQIQGIPQLTSTPDNSTIDFGTVVVNNTKTLTGAIFIENSGALGSELEITGFSLTGPNAARVFDR